MDMQPLTPTVPLFMMPASEHHMARRSRLFHSLKDAVSVFAADDKRALLPKLLLLLMAVISARTVCFTQAPFTILVRPGDQRDIECALTCVSRLDISSPLCLFESTCMGL